MRPEPIYLTAGCAGKPVAAHEVMRRCAAAETRAERAMCCCAAEGGAVGTRTITVPLAAW